MAKPVAVAARRKPTFANAVAGSSCFPTALATREKTAMGVMVRIQLIISSRICEGGSSCKERWEGLLVLVAAMVIPSNDA